MNTDELREKYLSFYESKGHTRVASDVLVPTWDPSVLFTPAGMNQFKDHFLGRVKLDFTKATTCQKCLRTGDIDNVGRTAYHHTFFEMMGNFSFGDYFKREAINWAWEFLTKKEWLGLDPNLLSVTVYKDDDEAEQIWKNDIKLTSASIQRLDEDENFWPASAPSQGPDGVCGPCSEIYYHPPGGEEVEIWNLVFTQFNRVGDPPDNLRPLPSKNIDTGMGLERTAATLQGVDTNYHIDILRPIVEAAGEICSTEYVPDSEAGRRLRRICDHVRACTFAVHENVYPGPNKEKYVIRRLLRRAVLDGHQMGLRDPFLHQLVPAVVDMMKAGYPDLAETSQRVADVIRNEESNFFGTIDAGLARIENIFSQMQSDGQGIVKGAEAADLYQTFGVPPELFETMASENNFTFDWDGFGKAMEEHGEASGKQQGVLFKTGPIETLKKSVQHTEFVGYDETASEVKICGIIAIADGEQKLCDDLSATDGPIDAILALDRTPFYGESGGQMGDAGEITAEGAVFSVSDTQKDGDLVLHHGKLESGTLKAGQGVTATVGERREGIRRAHSATHLLHNALQSTLGTHAQQQGSKVDEDWLRFDFTNMSPVTAEQLATIEAKVAKFITSADEVSWKTLPLAEAREAGAMMLFGEKYPDPVRMVSMGEYSRELCGGTHLDSTGDVQAFDIVSEEGVSAGTRRIIAFTGAKAQENITNTKNAVNEVAKALGAAALDIPSAVKGISQHVRDLKKHISGSGKLPEPWQPGNVSGATNAPYGELKSALREAARTLAVGAFDVPARVSVLLDEVKQLTEQASKLQDAGTLTADMLLEGAEEIGEAKIVVAEAPGASSNMMRQLIDQIRKKVGSSAVLLAAGADGKVILVAGVSRDLVDKGASAGNWVKATAPIVGGGGGGKPDMAQAGGKNPEKIPDALDAAKQSIREILS